MKKAVRFLSLPFNRKLLYTEAYLNLARARILKSMPFHKVAKGLGVQAIETAADSNTNPTAIKDVATAIRIMSKHTIWESACLVQAIAAMKMLERRGIESTIYLGTAKDEKQNMVAHAWLRSGPYYVTGAKGMNSFTVVGMFAKILDKKVQH
ncbi:lasso peptide biosynthesis B2 protein [Gracilibacillus oryzae]|uniref:Lasso peptide biosynthesis B2 protein n=1 Tax=Gracilibacillus oryzae TaxID=1672701 RepID=A0A7C8GTU9_9BACI|nr:lasso peptide biosynthesis B2 protein [Gracilibacillus oryzae]